MSGPLPWNVEQRRKQRRALWRRAAKTRSVAERGDPPGHYMSLAEELKTAAKSEIAVKGPAFSRGARNRLDTPGTRAILSLPYI